MEIENTKKFLKEAGCEKSEEISQIVKDSLGLRKRKPMSFKEEIYQVPQPQVNLHTSQVH
jgi:hypothetical protein